MGEIFESCHVPQQSRRNKLRVMVQTHHQTQSLAPPFEPNPAASPFNPNTLVSNFNSLTTPPFLQSLQKSSSFASHLEYPSSLHSLQPHLVSQTPCNELRNWVPIGPFTGYASILKRSRFLKPAQQLLGDFCGSVLDPPTLDCMSQNDNHKEPIIGTCEDGMQQQHYWRDSRLACMLQEVYKKHVLYCQQMQSVVASFQKVAGLGNATPYISYGIKTISKHFGYLKHAIYDQLQFKSKITPAANNFGEKEISKYSTFEKGLLHLPESVQNLHSVQPTMRSQRGFPDHAVALLKRWLFEHFLHPYPTDSEKDTLAQKTGLSRCQVSNWFINARVRIWKPMVEEMHMLREQPAQTLEVNHNMPSIGPLPPLHKPM